MPQNTSNLVYRLTLAAVFGLFLFLAVYKTTLLPASTDEVWISLRALAFANGDMSSITTALFFAPATRIPAMTGFYSGTLPNFLQIPFLYVFAPSYLPIRAGFIALAAGGLWGLLCCLRHWLGKWPALAALFLIVTNTMYVRALRQGSEHEELLIFNLFWIGAALLVLKARSGKTRYLAGAGLVFGIALCSKLHMFACMTGAAGAYLLFGFHRRARAAGTAPVNTAKDALILVLFFAIGLFPMINSQFNPKKNLVRGLSDCVAAPLTGASRVGLTQRFETRLAQFWKTAREKGCDEWPAAPHGVFPSLALFSLAFILYCLLARRKTLPQAKRPLAAGLCLFYGSIFLSLLFTPGGMPYAHMNAAIGFFELGLAILLWCLPGTGRIGTALAMVFALVIMHTLAARAALLGGYFAGLDGYTSQKQEAARVLEDALVRAGDTPLFVDYMAQAHLVSAQWLGLGPTPRRPDAPGVPPFKQRPLPATFFLLSCSPDRDCMKTGASAVWQTESGVKDRNFHYTLLSRKADKAPEECYYYLVTAQAKPQP